MHYGQIENLMRRVAQLVPRLQGRDDGVILIIGDRTQHIPENPNTVFWDNQYCERCAKTLPANTVAILTNGVHSHSATNNIRAICNKQGLDVPMYILPAGRLNELRRILLRHMCPDKYSGVKPEEQQPDRRPHTAPIPTPKPKPKPQDEPLRVLDYNQATKLFEDFFSREQVMQLSKMELMLEFAVVLEIGSYNLSPAVFCDILRHYYRLAKKPKPRCDKGRRRNRQGSPKRLPPRVSPSW